MKMSNGVYQALDPKGDNRPSSDKSEDADDIEVCLKTLYSQQKQEGRCSQHSGPWKSIAVSLGLVCVLLLCVIIVLSSNLSKTNISHDNLMKENSQSHTSYNKLRSEKAQLEHSYNHLSAEKHDLQNNCSSLNSEKSDLQNLEREKARLEDSYNQLSAECNTLKSEKSNLQVSNLQLQENYNKLNKEKYELQNHLNDTTVEKDKLLRRFCRARVDVTQHAVEVTLDPETACEYLTLSANGKQVVREKKPQPLPDSLKRFRYYAIQGTQGFSSGKFYYEVQVSGSKNWELGVVRESITKKEDQSARNSTKGYWIIKRTDGSYRPASLSPNVDPEMVGVFVDYEGGFVSFYDADSWTLIYSFENVSFKKKIYPYLFTGDRFPLIITTPVSCVN